MMRNQVHGRKWEKRGDVAADNFRNEANAAPRVENPQYVEEDAVELLQYLARHPSIDADALVGALSSAGKFSGSVDDENRQRSAPPLSGPGAVPPPTEHFRGATRHGGGPKNRKNPASFPPGSLMEPTTPPSTFANVSVGSANTGATIGTNTSNMNNTSNTSNMSNMSNMSNRGEQGWRRAQRMQQKIQQHAQVTTTLPHAQFLTAPHKRTGRGGRRPSVDPRMDPNIDPKKAKRILANRLSAAKSTLKKKIRAELVGARIENLLRERRGLEAEVVGLEMRFTAALQANAQLIEMIEMGRP